VTAAASAPTREMESKMRIAIATENGCVSAHFGRCPAYTLAEIKDGEVVKLEEIPNPGHSPGFLPSYLSELGIKAIIAGGMGPRAQGLFAEQNIQTIAGVQGRIDEVVRQFIRGELATGRDLCDHGQHHQGPCRHEKTPGKEENGWPSEGVVWVSATGPDLEAEVEPHFGRAPYFLLVDPATLEYKAIVNPHSEAAQGAGFRTAQLIASRPASAVLTGQLGPKALQILETAGIRVMTVEKGSVREAISRLKRS